jgi:DNA-directed RNA polymerase specialized sigma24 family protein
MMGLLDRAPRHDVPGPRGRPPLGITANAEDAENAIRTIDELSPYHRALIMRDVEDWSCAEIAEVLGVSVGGVRRGFTAPGSSGSG